MTTEEKAKTKAAIAELEAQIRKLQAALDEDTAQPPAGFPKPTGQTLIDIQRKEEQERKDRDVKGWS